MLMLDFPLLECAGLDGVAIAKAAKAGEPGSPAASAIPAPPTMTLRRDELTDAFGFRRS
jgi:hypothetical protein